LKKIRNQIQAWKAKIKDLKSDFTFDELVKSLQEGFSLGFKHPELQGLFDRGKKILIWTIQVINLIKKYDNDFKSKILNETYSNDLSLIISKNLIIFEDDSNQLSFLLDDFPSEVCIGPEFSKLDELKKQADDWSRRVKEELQKKRDFDPLVIQGLLEESVRFPSEL